MKLSGIVRGVIGGLLLALAVLGAIVVPSLVAGPEGVFAEVPVALPPASGLSVVHATVTPAPHDRQAPRVTAAAQPKPVRVFAVRPAPKVVARPPVQRPVSRPVTPAHVPVPAPSPAPVPSPTPVPEPAPTPAPSEREILVSEPGPEAVTPPQGRPVVDEPDPPKDEGEKKGHEKNEPQGNAYGRAEDQQGGPKPGRGPRD